MKKFTILHPVGSMNHECTIGTHKYKHVATVMSEEIGGVFFRAQNCFDKEYAQNKVRSTSVGDIIVDNDDETYHMIMGMGLAQIITPEMDAVDSSDKFNPAFNSNIDRCFKEQQIDEDYYDQLEDSPY